MRIPRSRNSQTVRLPVTVVKILARLRGYRGRLPADFKFDRLEANEER